MIQANILVQTWVGFHFFFGLNNLLNFAIFTVKFSKIGRKAGSNVLKKSKLMSSVFAKKQQLFGPKTCYR